MFKVEDKMPTSNRENDFEIIFENISEWDQGTEERYTVAKAFKGNTEHLLFKPKFDDRQMKYSNKIGLITIYSDKYRTKGGIGINSTIQDFFTKYKKVEIT
ncbi:MAG: hypothetical protein CMF23_12355 [Ignavibacteriae bacterium]|nr:hypothetical protein [Ignavibacteriota bacterium]